MKFSMQPLFGALECLCPDMRAGRAFRARRAACGCRMLFGSDSCRGGISFFFLLLAINKKRNVE